MAKPFYFNILAISNIDKRALLLSLVLAFSQGIFSQSLHQSLRQGDGQYDRNNFKAAEKQYRTAADLAYNNPKALYNLGNALYQQGKWEDAAERFNQAVKLSSNTVEQANALHNLGNALLKQRKFKEAVAAYENSLHLRPGDQDSKMNLQMAKQKFQEEQQKNKEPQQNQSQSQDNKPDESQQQPQNQQDEKQQQQPKNQPQQNKSGQPQQPQEQPQQEPNQPGKLKKEEAKRILETAIGPEDQRNARKYREAKQQSKPRTSKKDW
jgi:Ca-activated chloride channel family protein